jgi:hypothetical protein
MTSLKTSPVRWCDITLIYSLAETRRQLTPRVYQLEKLKGQALSTPPKTSLALTLLMTRLGTANHTQCTFATYNLAVSAYFFN